MNPDEQPVSHESRASLIHVGTLMKLTDFPVVPQQVIGCFNE